MVHSGRGKRLFEEASDPFWIRYAEHGGVRYSLNRDHTVLNSFKKILGGNEQRLFQEVLSVIEDSIPVEAIYSDYSMVPKSFDNNLKIDPEEIRKRLHILYEILSAEQHLDEKSFREIIDHLKPFSDYPQEIERVIKEKLNV